MRAPVDYDETRTALLASHSALHELARTGDLVVSGDGRDALAAEYELRIRNAERELGSLASRVADVAPEAGAPLATRRLIYETERQRILDAFHAGGISRAMRDRLIHELDTMWWDLRPEP